MQTSIATADDGTVVLTSPYSAALPDRAKALGGRWHPASKTWRFVGDRLADVEALAAEMYGWTPPDGDTAVSTVRLRLADEYRDAELRICGRLIARRPGRDQAVRLGPGVSLVDGAWQAWAGSKASPAISRVGWDDGWTGCTVEIRGLSLAQAERFVAEAGAVLVGPDQ